MYNNDYDCYIDALETAEEKHTAEEWREIIAADMADLKAQGAPEEATDIDIDYIIKKLEEDDFIIE